jgi:AcrR family transcriptional regulator
MERGCAATSPRMITAKAKINLAAVNYHFGSKDALIREVFERRLGPLNPHASLISMVLNPTFAAGRSPPSRSWKRSQACAAVQDRQRFRPQGWVKPVHGFAILGARK